MTAKSDRADPDTEAPEHDAGAEPAEPEVDTGDAHSDGEAGRASGAEGGADAADLEAEINDLRERLTRAMAETENVRRRAERERKDALKYAASPLAKDLLGVVDNLRRALDSVPAEEVEGNETLKTLMSGVEMTEKELLSAFEKHGIQQMAVEPGQRFDPHYHEAMFEVPTDQQQPGTIVHVLQHGYMLHDRLLRPARVGVAKSAGGDSNTQGNVDTSA
jgi:molecular chaperone GrpE